MNFLLDYVQLDGVRHLHLLEELPLWEGLLVLPNPDPDWIWVYEENGVAKSALVCAPVHGVVFMVRLINFGGASLVSVRALLREAALECRSRGYFKFMIVADAKRPLEGHLLGLARRFGALDEQNYTLGAGTIPESL